MNDRWEFVALALLTSGVRAAYPRALAMNTPCPEGLSQPALIAAIMRRYSIRRASAATVGRTGGCKVSTKSTLRFRGDQHDVEEPIATAIVASHRAQVEAAASNLILQIDVLL